MPISELDNELLIDDAATIQPIGDTGLFSPAHPGLRTDDLTTTTTAIRLHEHGYIPSVVNLSALHITHLDQVGSPLSMQVPLRLFPRAYRTSRLLWRSFLNERG